MTPSAWIALCLLGLALLGHIITVTIYLTKVHMRLIAVESSCAEMRGVSTAIAVIQTEMHGVREDVRKIGAGLDWLRPLAEPIVPTPRRRKPSE